MDQGTAADPVSSLRAKPDEKARNKDKRDALTPIDGRASLYMLNKAAA
ncbi:hypothetical protein [Paenibacillus sp. SSG-1]|nr:hypothetical protein [Paenibacillus sp. SSG-1]